ncbi:MULTISPECIES: helix-turn-helix domain-containing protein [Kaistia]|uniref:Helix-turn-helix domain-containing protein n=1 Tax=Kaistia nematophila TaxID=2994654 RepID=A0A9X3E552_9HYPH|nr:helix-turn-helix domain-containing protein [Kaistia nematophila]MBN9026795.1 helix-turn-helix transcriptional regulator [Hyphomicrobiales bacterium]MCX5570937.1 helix-turn-helix domain-containing protein [Kaistia nematophila]
MPTHAFPRFTGLSGASSFPPEGVVATAAKARSPLTAIRQDVGLTRAELAEQSGVDLIIIMLAERGSDLLPHERAAIAAVLQIDEFQLGG